VRRLGRAIPTNPSPATPCPASLARKSQNGLGKVFVSSTYEDLREERAAVQKGLLQLGCLPVELFPAADEETWNFIKSQIDDSDYYVVVVAGCYGSQGPDGTSFTEMEYDYAIDQKKPAIGFVHADPGSIVGSKLEISEETRAKLHKFIEKIKKRPVRQFKSPHELALEVTTSSVQLIRDRPADGYVRTSASVDFKKYSEVLEENSRLKEALSSAQKVTVPFPAHEKPIQLIITRGFHSRGYVTRGFDRGEHAQTVDCSLRQAFQAVAEGALLYDVEHDVLGHAANLLGKSEGNNKLAGFADTSVKTLRRELLLYDLIEIRSEDRSSYGFNKDSITTRTHTVTVWKLTEYGRRQLIAIAP
jgi:Domain of unknown function (DUF4062)